MFRTTIEMSTGHVTVQVSCRADIVDLVAMLANGAQVREGWSITVTDLNTMNTVSASSRSVQGAHRATEQLMEVLATLPPRPRDINANYDVVVPVHLAVDGTRQLVDAEDFVRAAIEKALAEHHEAVANAPYHAQFNYNGEVVFLGSAKENV